MPQPESKADVNGQVHVPEFSKAGCVVNPGPNFRVVIEDVPVPKPGPDELLLRLNATGLCFSDVHYMLENLPMPKMSDFGVRSPGHEGAGVVVAMGENVKNWKIGDRGEVKPMWDCCMNCELCWGHHETHCEKAVDSGLKVPGRPFLATIWTTAVHGLLVVDLFGGTQRARIPQSS